MKGSFSIWFLQTVLVLAVLFTKASEGSSQSLQFLTGVAIETTSTTSEPFEVKAVYGDFVNTNPIWAQLWQGTADPYQFELVWQVKVKPTRGNGTDEWIILPEEDRFTMTEDHRLGLMNDVTPGPLVQYQDLNSNIIITKENVQYNDVKVGETVDFEDLNFPYHMSLYLCHRTDCRDVRIMLDRLTLSPPTSPVTQHLTTETEPATEAPVIMTTSPESTISEDPSEESVKQDDLFNKRTIIGILLGLAVLAFVLFVVVAVLIGVCVAMEKKRKHEERYRTNTFTTGTSGGHSNDGFESITSERSDTSSKRLVTRQLPEQSIIVY